MQPDYPMNDFPMQPEPEFELPPTVEEIDDQIRKEYNRFMRNRPHVDIPNLSSLAYGAELSQEVRDFFSRRLFTVELPWDVTLPEYLQPLMGARVSEFKGKLERPLYDIYFNPQGSESVSCPKTHTPIVTSLRLMVPYKASTEEAMGIEYVAPTPDGYPISLAGYVFLIPNEYLQEYLPYTLTLSRSKLKCEQYYRISLASNSTIYMSIVQAPANASRFQNTSVVPLISQFHSDFTQYIPLYASHWVSQGIIPPPSQFTLSTGECLSFQHVRLEDSDND